MMILLKLIGLGRGHSGVRREVIDALAALLAANAMPLIPSQGSVGAPAHGPLDAWQREGEPNFFSCRRST